LAAIQVAREEKLAFEAQNDEEDDEGFEAAKPLRIAPTLVLGPVGTADGGTGEIDSVWAEGEDEEDSGLGTKQLGKGKGVEAGEVSGPPGKRVKPN
jgi:hypothetical protein